MEAVNTAITTAGTDALSVGFIVLGVLAGFTVIKFAAKFIGTR